MKTVWTKETIEFKIKVCNSWLKDLNRKSDWKEIRKDLKMWTKLLKSAN